MGLYSGRTLTRPAPALGRGQAFNCGQQAYLHAMLRPLMLGALRVYKIALSPLVQAFGIRCRYEPTCSTYSVEAIRKHGGWLGGWMTLARLCRCHPLGGSGLDRVPEETPDVPVWAPWRAANWRTPPDSRS